MNTRKKAPKKRPKEDKENIMEPPKSKRSRASSGTGERMTSRLRIIYDSIISPKKITRRVYDECKEYDDKTAQNVFEHIGTKHRSFRVILCGSSSPEKIDVPIGKLGTAGWLKTLTTLLNRTEEDLSPVCDATFKDVSASGTFILRESMGSWSDPNPTGAVRLYLRRKEPAEKNTRLTDAKDEARTRKGKEGVFAVEGSGAAEQKDANEEKEEEDEIMMDLRPLSRERKENDEGDEGLYWTGAGELKGILRCCIARLDAQELDVGFEEVKTDGLSMKRIEERIIAAAIRRSLMLSTSEVRDYQGYTLQSGDITIDGDMIGGFKRGQGISQRDQLRKNICLLLFSCDRAWDEDDFISERDDFFRICKPRLSFPNWILGDSSSESESGATISSSSKQPIKKPRKPPSPQKEKKSSPKKKKKPEKKASPKKEKKASPKKEKKTSPKKKRERKVSIGRKFYRGGDIDEHTASLNRPRPEILYSTDVAFVLHLHV